MFIRGNMHGNQSPKCFYRMERDWGMYKEKTWPQDQSLDATIKEQTQALSKEQQEILSEISKHIKNKTQINLQKLQAQTKEGLIKQVKYVVSRYPELGELYKRGIKENKLYLTNQRAKVYIQLQQSKKHLGRFSKDIKKDIDGICKKIANGTLDLSKQTSTYFREWEGVNNPDTNWVSKDTLSYGELLGRLIPDSRLLQNAGFAVKANDKKIKEKEKETAGISPENAIIQGRMQDFLSALEAKYPQAEYRNDFRKLQRRVADIHTDKDVYNTTSAIDSFIWPDTDFDIKRVNFTDDYKFMSMYRQIEDTGTAARIAIEGLQGVEISDKLKKAFEGVDEKSKKYEASARQKYKKILQAVEGKHEYAQYINQREDMIRGFMRMEASLEILDTYIEQNPEEAAKNDIMKVYDDMRGINDLFSDEGARLATDIAILAASMVLTFGAGAALTATGLLVRWGVAATRTAQAVNAAQKAGKIQTVAWAVSWAGRAAVSGTIRIAGYTFTTINKVPVLGQAASFTAWETLLSESLNGVSGIETSSRWWSDFMEKFKDNTKMFAAFAGAGAIFGKIWGKIFPIWENASKQAILIKEVWKWTILTNGDIAAMYTLHSLDTGEWNMEIDELAHMAVVSMVFRWAAAWISTKMRMNALNTVAPNFDTNLKKNLDAVFEKKKFAKDSYTTKDGWQVKRNWDNTYTIKKGNQEYSVTKDGIKKVSTKPEVGPQNLPEHLQDIKVGDKVRLWKGKGNVEYTVTKINQDGGIEATGVTKAGRKVTQTLSWKKLENLRITRSQNNKPSSNTESTANQTKPQINKNSERGDMQFSSGPKKLIEFGANQDEKIKSILDKLRARWKSYDTIYPKGINIKPEQIKYHGSRSWRPIVEVVINGKSEYFYKSSGWAGKEWGGKNGTTEGLWQPFGGFGDIFTPRGRVSNWFIKDSGYKNYYGSQAFRSVAWQLDNVLIKKLGVKDINKLNEKIKFKDVSKNTYKLPGEWISKPKPTQKPTQTPATNSEFKIWDRIAGKNGNGETVVGDVVIAPKNAKRKTYTIRDENGKLHVIKQENVILSSKLKWPQKKPNSEISEGSKLPKWLKVGDTVKIRDTGKTKWEVKGVNKSDEVILKGEPGRNGERPTVYIPKENWNKILPQNTSRFRDIIAKAKEKYPNRLFQDWVKTWALGVAAMKLIDLYKNKRMKEINEDQIAEMLSNLQLFQVAKFDKDNAYTTKLDEKAKTYKIRLRATQRFITKDSEWKKLITDIKNREAIIKQTHGEVFWNMLTSLIDTKKPSELKRNKNESDKDLVERIAQFQRAIWIDVDDSKTGADGIIGPYTRNMLAGFVGKDIEKYRAANPDKYKELKGQKVEKVHNIDIKFTTPVGQEIRIDEAEQEIFYVQSLNPARKKWFISENIWNPTSKILDIEALQKFLKEKKVEGTESKNWVDGKLGQKTVTALKKYIKQEEKKQEKSKKEKDAAKPQKESKSNEGSKATKSVKAQADDSKEKTETVEAEKKIDPKQTQAPEKKAAKLQDNKTDSSENEEKEGQNAQQTSVPQQWQTEAKNNNTLKTKEGQSILVDEEEYKAAIEKIQKQDGLKQFYNTETWVLDITGLQGALQLMSTAKKIRKTSRWDDGKFWPNTIRAIDEYIQNKETLSKPVRPPNMER